MNKRKSVFLDDEAEEASIFDSAEEDEQEEEENSTDDELPLDLGDSDDVMELRPNEAPLPTDDPLAEFKVRRTNNPVSPPKKKKLIVIDWNDNYELYKLDEAIEETGPILKLDGLPPSKALCNWVQAVHFLPTTVFPKPTPPGYDLNSFSIDKVFIGVDPGVKNCGVVFIHPRTHYYSSRTLDLLPPLSKVQSAYLTVDELLHMKSVLFRWLTEEYTAILERTPSLLPREELRKSLNTMVVCMEAQYAGTFSSHGKFTPQTATHTRMIHQETRLEMMFMEYCQLGCSVTPNKLSFHRVATSRVTKLWNLKGKTPYQPGWITLKRFLLSGRVRSDVISVLEQLPRVTAIEKTIAVKDKKAVTRSTISLYNDVCDSVHELVKEKHPPSVDEWVVHDITSLFPPSNKNRYQRTIHEEDAQMILYTQIYDLLCDLDVFID